MITRELLQSVLHYQPATGEFTWLPRVGNDAATREWNARYAGRAAGGTSQKYGYVRICIDGRLYYGHRLAWLYITGEWPVEQIDHKNGERDDNRSSNLREATGSENLANSKRRADNTSGTKGVSWDRRNKCWRVGLRKKKRVVLSTRVKTLDEAGKTYAAAARAQYGEFARP